MLWLPLDDWRTQREPDEDVNHHLYTWTPLLLHNLLDEAGFEVRECRVVTHAWPRYYRSPVQAASAAARSTCSARAWAVLRRRRQVMALAERPS